MDFDFPVPDEAEVRARARTFISDDEFNSLLKNEAVQHLRKFQQNQQEGIAPRLLVYAKDFNDIEKPLHLETIELDFPGFNDWQTRHEYLEFLGKRMHRQLHKNRLGVVCIFLISETWQRTFKAKERRGSKPIEEYKDKQESLIIQGKTLDDRDGMAIFPITRSPDKKIILGFPTVNTFIEDAERKSISHLLNRFYYGYMMAIMHEKKPEIAAEVAKKVSAQRAAVKRRMTPPNKRPKPQGFS